MRRRSIGLLLALALALAGCGSEPVDLARKAAGAALGQVRVANTGGEGVYVRRTPRLTDRIKAWPDGTILSIVGADVEGEGRQWKHVLDPDGNVGYVPSQYIAIVSAGADPAELERLARQEAQRLAREAAEQAARERLPEPVASAFSAILGFLRRWSDDGQSAKGGSTLSRTDGPLRVAILLPGISTESSTEFRGGQSASLGQVYRLLGTAQEYDDVIFFSYTCGSARSGTARPEWTPSAYVYTNTFQKLEVSAAQLKCLVSAYQGATGRPVTFDLIGHSLGGAVAFRYLKDGGGAVARLVTLDSPINGANPYTAEIWRKIQDRYAWVRHIPWPGRERVGRATEMFDSTAAAELKAQGQDPVAARTKNADVFHGLAGRGVTVRTYVNQRDLVVSALDAGSSFNQSEFTRGRNLEEFWFDFLGINPVNVIPWLNDADENHGLITRVLDDDPVAQRQRKQLCEHLEIACGP